MKMAGCFRFGHSYTGRDLLQGVFRRRLRRTAWIHSTHRTHRTHRKAEPQGPPGFLEPGRLPAALEQSAHLVLSPAGSQSGRLAQNRTMTSVKSSR